MGSLHCATFSPARPGRAKTRPCPLASTALSCAFCEQRGRPLRPPLLLPSLKGLGNSGEGMVGLSSTARVQRGPSQAARCASKEDGPTIPFSPSLPKDREAFRKGAVAGFNCAHRTSTVSSCAFCEQGSRQGTLTLLSAHPLQHLPIRLFNLPQILPKPILIHRLLRCLIPKAAGVRRYLIGQDQLAVVHPKL